jgi:hypothetical protein
MIRKHLVLIGVIISLALLVLAASQYPGGSQADKNSVGYDWANNYISNLFGENSFNGTKSGSRIWAIGAMISLSLSLAIFFFQFSRRIPQRSSALIIRSFGAGGMLFSALAVTQWHDQMITVASTMFLLSIFYITVFVFKTKLHLLKILCTICLLCFYGMLFLFGAGFYLQWMPILQKVTFATTISTVLALQYLASKEDFEHIVIGK